MRITRSLWLTLVCVLVAALVAAGKVAAAPKKRLAAHKRAHRAAHVLGPRFSRGERALAIARTMIGVPYSWGGSSPSGFDCSGLVMFAFGRVGMSLPHSSYALMGLGRRVGRWALKPG